MINISEIITDPDFMQQLAVQRSSGAFVLGGYQSTVTSIPMPGIVIVAKDQDLDTVPEGDRIGGAMAFYTLQEVFETNVAGGLSGTSGISDVITWRGQNYRIADVKPYADYGYWKSIGVRMTGE
jgi:hypothetical protein